MKKVIFVIASSIIVSSVLYIKTQQEATPEPAPKKTESAAPVSLQNLKNSLDSVAQSIIQMQRFISENKDTIALKLFKQKKDLKILEQINTFLSKIQVLRSPELIIVLQKNSPIVEKIALIQQGLNQNKTDTVESTMKAILLLDESISNNILSDLQALEPEKPKKEDQKASLSDSYLNDTNFDDMNFEYDSTYNFDDSYSKPYDSSSYYKDDYDQFLDI